MLIKFAVLDRRNVYIQQKKQTKTIENYVPVMELHLDIQTLHIQGNWVFFFTKSAKKGKKVMRWYKIWWCKRDDINGVTREEKIRRIKTVFFDILKIDSKFKDDTQ